jgi:hypothetical protein
MCIIQVLKSKVSLMNQEALQETQGTYYSTNNETKVVSRRIICNADSPQLASTSFFSKTKSEKKRKKPLQLTYPPTTGPMHLARLAMLCAIPFA